MSSKSNTNLIRIRGTYERNDYYLQGAVAKPFHKNKKREQQQQLITYNHYLLLPGEPEGHIAASAISGNTGRATSNITHILDASRDVITMQCQCKERERAVATHPPVAQVPNQ